MTKKNRKKQNARKSISQMTNGSYLNIKSRTNKLEQDRDKFTDEQKSILEELGIEIGGRTAVQANTPELRAKLEKIKQYVNVTESVAVKGFDELAKIEKPELEEAEKAEPSEEAKTKDDKVEDTEKPIAVSDDNEPAKDESAYNGKADEEASSSSLDTMKQLAEAQAKAFDEMKSKHQEEEIQEGSESAAEDITDAEAAADEVALSGESETEGAQTPDTEKEPVEAPEAKEELHTADHKIESEPEHKPEHNPEAPKTANKRKFGWGIVAGATVVGVIAGLLIGAQSAKDVSISSDAHQYTSQQILDYQPSSSLPTQSKFRSKLIYDSLNKKYDSKKLNDKVDDSVANVKAKYKGEQFKEFLNSQGITSESQLRQNLKTQLMLNKYMDDKTSTADLKKAYKDWLPNQSMTFAEFSSQKEANEALKDWNSSKDSMSDKVEAFTKDHNATQTRMNSGQTTFDTDEFNKFAKGKAGSAHIFKISATSGKDDYVMVILTNKANKGSFNEEKSMIQTSLRQKMTSDPAAFGKQFVKDFNIQGHDDFGKELVKQMTTQQQN